MEFLCTAAVCADPARVVLRVRPRARIVPFVARAPMDAGRIEAIGWQPSIWLTHFL